MVIAHAAFFGVMVYRFNHMQVNTDYEAPFGIPWACVMPGWIILGELARFSVPLFIVLSGHFIKNLNGKWITIWKQGEIILYPFLFWSLIGWLYSFLFSPPGWDIGTFISKLFSGDAQPGYYFIPLIIQYYVLSRWLVPWVKIKPKSALIISLIIQLASIGLFYFSLAIKGKVITFPIELPLIPSSLFPRYLFFFVFGIWMGVYPDRFKSIINGRGPLLFILSLLSAIFLIGEHGVLYYFIRKPGSEIELWRVFTAMGMWKITTNIWAFFIILFLIRLGQFNFFSWKWLAQLGMWSYIIYILNGPCLQPIVKLLNTWSISPQYHFLIFLALTAITILFPILIVYAVQRWIPRARYITRYVIGNK
jgi:probable poly-beta-1,6-N-acetyl-D-glucosamine export protein